MGHWAKGQADSSSMACLLREESTLNPGQGPPGLGDPGSLFLEGQDQQHGEDGSPSGGVAAAWVLLRVDRSR